MSTINNSRIAWVDQLRGFAILIVVIGHLIHFNNFGVENALAEIIWSFHMMLFFAISGYVAELTTHVSNIKELALYSKKKIIAIGFPWFFWGIIIERWAFSSQWSGYTLVEFLDFWNSTWLWFFGALFWMTLVYGIHKYIYEKLNNHVLRLCLPIFITLILTVIIFALNLRSIDQFLWTIGFYMGAFMRRYNRFYQLCSNKNIVTFAFVFFVAVSGHWRWFGSTIDDIYKVTCSLAAILFLFYIFANQQQLFSEKIKNMFSLFGVNSLLIYVMQFYMTAILPVNNVFAQMNNIILFLLCFFIAIGICYVCVWIANLLRCFPILDLFLLGNHKVKLF